MRGATDASLFFRLSVNWLMGQLFRHLHKVGNILVNSDRRSEKNGMDTANRQWDFTW